MTMLDATVYLVAGLRSRNEVRASFGLRPAQATPVAPLRVEVFGMPPATGRVLAEMATAGVAPARPARDLAVLAQVFPLHQCDPTTLSRLERARRAVPSG